MSDFLFEIGLEEVPARMIASAEAELARRLTALLERERLTALGAAVKSFSTPRRLAVLVSGVAAKQEDLSEDLQGPSAKIAYKDGVPTPAAHAFAKKAGVAVEALRTIDTPKGEYLAATAVKPGRSAAEVLIAELPKELTAIYWAKNMYWRPGKPERFVRPVRWIVALLDSEVVPVHFAGYTASNLTYGHRVLAGPDAITLSTPAEYASTLEKAFVLADVEARRHKIRKALDHVCRSIPDQTKAVANVLLGARPRWREDHELVDKLTHLTEWPSVVAGRFEEAYLKLPQEVLVTVMRDHQNYFAVEDAAGTLAPHFLAVLNTVANPEGEAVIRHGNERVLRARFNDARFFFDFDQRIPLTERVELLKSVTFQKDLGSYADKSSRVVSFCDRLESLVKNSGTVVDYNALKSAAALAKTDLTTELVKEFTELQGIIGGLYAREQGSGDATTAATADAIYDHYLPTSMDAPIPRTVEGQLLAIADKADTISGMFSLGMEPTGSKDPFALRRAANGIVKILAESDLPLTFKQITKTSSQSMTGWSAELESRILSFFAERLDFYLREARNHAYDVVKAVLATGSDDVRDTLARAEALTAVRGSEDFLAVSAAFKRMKNILAQAAEKGIAPATSISEAHLTDPTEQALASRSAQLAADVELLRAEKNYKAALEQIASLRPQVDAFFDTVMVMALEPEVRANRLALLTRITADLSRIADFSEIVVAG